MSRPAMLKEVIYKSALELFGEQGLAGTSIRDLARRANVSEGSLYRHWPSKRALGWDIFKTNLETLAAQIRRRTDGVHSNYEQVRLTIRTFYELFDRERNLFRFILLNQHELWPRLGETADHPVKLWDQFVTDHLSPVRMKSLPLELATSMTLGMILQPAVAAIYGSVSLPLVQHVDQVALQVCRILGIEERSESGVDNPSDTAEN